MSSIDSILTKYKQNKEKKKKIEAPQIPSCESTYIIIPYLHICNPRSHSNKLLSISIFQYSYVDFQKLEYQHYRLVMLYH